MYTGNPCPTPTKDGRGCDCPLHYTRCRGWVKIVHADFNRHFEEGGLVNALAMTLKEHPQWSEQELIDRFLEVRRVQ